MRAHVNGVDIEYSIDGDQGPWLVMSHSLGCTRSMWDPQMTALAHRYRVLRYDTRGHGASQAPAGPYTLEQLADDADPSVRAAVARRSGVPRPLLERRFGIFLEIGGLTRYDLGLLGAIIGIAFLMGALPAWRAYRNTLSDGLTIRV